jgi:hypothetical protein
MTSYDFGAQFDFGLDLILDGLAAQPGKETRSGIDTGCCRGYGFNG